MAAELSDAEVFGSTSAPTAVPREMSDAEVFRGPFDPVEPSYPGYVQRPLITSAGIGSLVSPTMPGPPPDEPPSPRWTEANPAFAAGGPRESLPPTSVDLGRIGGAMAEGWRATPSFLAPEMRDRQSQLYGPVGGSIVNSLFSLPGAVPAGINSLLYGGAELANQVTGDPRAGRDALMLGQTALTLGGAVPRVGAPAVEAPLAPRPQFVSERFAPNVSELDPRNAITQLLRHDAAENPPAAPDRGIANQSLTSSPISLNPLAYGDAVPVGSPPENGMLPPAPPQAGPRSMGAAASRDLTDPALLTARTRGQAQTDFEKSVMQTAEERAGPEGIDHNAYVEGATRPQAAREFSVANSVDEKTLRATDPAFAQNLKRIYDDSRGVTDDAYKNLAGDPRALEVAHDARSEVSPGEMGVFTDQKPSDATPLINAVDAILAGPDGKRTAVASMLGDVRKTLFDADGNPETLPNMIYGARKNITDKLAKTGTDADARAAKAELASLIPVADQAITAGAPQFANYLSKWSELSKPIDQMELLQGKLLGPGKITDANGHVTEAGIQKLLEKIAVDKKARGNNAAKSLTEDQLQSLISVRNELAANGYAARLANGPGSDTVQKASAVGRLMDAPATDAVIHAGLAMSPFAGTGNVLYSAAIKPTINLFRARSAAKNLADLKTRLLSTSPPDGTPPIVRGSQFALPPIPNKNALLGPGP